MQREQPDDSSPAERRRPWGKLVDRVFGYDYFISYAWGDGSVYAKALAAALRKSGFECFLDSDKFRAGEDWRKAGSWTLRRTSSLVMVGSPKAVKSEPVLYELEAFRRYRNRVVPIDFDGTLDPRTLDARLLKHLPPDVIRLRDSSGNLDSGPSEEVVRRLRDDFKGIRQSQWRARLLAVVAVTFAAIAFLALALWRAERRLTMISIAQKLAAEAMNEAGRNEYERAALLARQAYLINHRHHGDSIARVDQALRTVLGARLFNAPLAANVRELGPLDKIAVRAVAVSMNTGVLAVATTDSVGIARLRDPALTIHRLGNERLQYPALAMTTDGTLLAVAGSARGVLLYDLGKADPQPQVLPVANGEATCVAFERDGRLLVAGTSKGTVHSWRVGDGEEPRQIGQSADGKSINAIAINPDSTKVATAAADGGIELWDVATGVHRVLLKKARSLSHHSLDFSPDGRWLVAASTNPAAVLIWSMKKPAEPPTRHQISSPISAAFTADGRYLIVGGGLGQVYLWQAESLDQFPDSVAAHKDEIRAITAVPTDGRLLTGSRDHTIRLWTPYSHNEGSFRWASTGRVRPVLASLSDDDWIAYSFASQSGVTLESDGSWRLHENIYGKERVTSLGNISASTAAFSETGRFLALAEISGEDDRRVVLWDLKQRSRPVTMRWNETPKSASSTKVKAESLDSGVVRLIQNGEPPGNPVILAVPGSRSAPGISFFPGSDVLLTMSKPSERFTVERTLRLQVALTASLADEVCTRVRRNLTPAEWQQFVGGDLPYETTCPGLALGGV